MAALLTWVPAKAPGEGGNDVLRFLGHVIPAKAGIPVLRPPPTYFFPQTFIMSSEPCERTPLSDRIASVASSVAWRGRIIDSP